MRAIRRASVLAMVAAGLMSVRCEAQDPKILHVPEISIEASDDHERRLLKERFNAVVKESRAEYSLYRQGKVRLPEVADAIERFAKAGVEVAETPAERARNLELAFDTAKAIEVIAEDKYAHEVEPQQAMLRAKGLRIDMELQLLRATRQAAAASDEHERQLLKERYNAAVEELPYTYKLYQGGKGDLAWASNTIERLATAGAELAQTPAEKVKHLEAGFDVAKQLEELVQSRYDSDVEPKHAMLQTKGLRIDMELQLLRARRQAAAAERADK